MMTAGFTEEWFGAASQDELRRLAAKIADVDGLVVEIGSWEGRSTCALANAVWPRTVHAVDTWQGSAGEISEQLATGRDVFAQWSANIAAYTMGSVIPHRMGWREFLPLIDVPVAFAFIDAEHTYAEVFDNIVGLLPLLADGAVLCGDDQHHRPVREAVLAALPADEVMVCATVWSWTK